MDLADTPAIPGRKLSPRQGRSDRSRLLTPAEAQDVAFVRDWEQLSAQAGESNPFFEPWFQLPSLVHLGHERVSIFAFYRDGQLAGLIPLAFMRDYYGRHVPHVTAWLHENAFCGSPLVASGLEREFWSALFALLDDEPGRALFLHLPQVPDGGPSARALESVVVEGRRHWGRVAYAERAMLSSDLTPEAYVAKTMSAKKRKELRRQHRRLAELGRLDFDWVDHSEGIAHWIDDFLTLEAAGWKGESRSALASSIETRAFFEKTLFGGCHAGRLQGLSLRLDGRPIAMLANFVTPPGVFSFKTAFDEDFARYSPGLLLQIENLKLLERENIAWADSCAAQGHSMIERLWRERRTMSSYNIAIGGALRRGICRLLIAYELRDRSAP